MPAGRPSKYKTEYEDQVYKLCLLGATDTEIANFFEISESTLNEWKKDYPKFSESIKRGKYQADANVADRLYQRAIGYEHPEVITASYQGEITDMKTVTKHYAPDPTAAIFWLKNRQPKQWRDKQEVDSNIKADVNSTNTNVNMSYEEYINSDDYKKMLELDKLINGNTSNTK